MEFNMVIALVLGVLVLLIGTYIVFLANGEIDNIAETPVECKIIGGTCESSCSGTILTPACPESTVCCKAS